VAAATSHHALAERADRSPTGPASLVVAIVIGLLLIGCSATESVSSGAPASVASSSSTNSIGDSASSNGSSEPPEGLSTEASSPPKQSGGPPVVVTDSTFASEVVGSDKPVLVFFWAAWCGPCLRLSPTIETISREHGDKLRVTKLNVDENAQTTEQYHIASIPTIAVFVNGDIVKTITGTKSEDALLQSLSSFI
jgi:thioredoxin 1